MRTVHILLLTGMVLLWTAGPVRVEAATQMQDLENALMCKCDDNCGKVLINCTCDTSKQTRKTLMAKLESGLTVDQIVQQFVDQYGETVLSAPTKSGFNLSAWITPFAALVVGGLGVRKIITAWTRPPAVSGEDSGGGHEASVSDPESGKISKRLKDELDRLES